MNKEQWKQMSFRQKLEWLVQYYGVTAIVCVIAILVAFSLAKSFLSGNEKGDMRIIILDDCMPSETCYSFQKEISRIIEGEAEITSYAKSDPIHMQAFSIRLTADDLDIVIAPATEMLEMAGNGYLIPYEPGGITEFFSDYSEENQLKIHSQDGSEEIVVGLKLESNSRYMRYRREAGEEEMYLGITIKKINDDNIKTTAQFFLEK